MAKFYVQSGTLRIVIDSLDIERAALWAVHRAMQQIAPIDGESEMTPDAKSCELAASSLIVLGESIEISEVGFDRPDAVKIDTFDAFHEWHCLLNALDRLERLL